MRDPSSYTSVGLGANASDETVFLERRVSNVTAIIQSPFGHLPESQQDRGFSEESCGTNFARLRPPLPKGAQCRFNAGTHKRDILELFLLNIWDPKN